MLVPPLVLAIVMSNVFIISSGYKALPTSVIRALAALRWTSWRLTVWVTHRQPTLASTQDSSLALVLTAMVVRPAFAIKKAVTWTHTEWDYIISSVQAPNTRLIHPSLLKWSLNFWRLMEPIKEISLKSRDTMLKMEKRSRFLTLLSRDLTHWILSSQTPSATPRRKSLEMKTFSLRKEACFPWAKPSIEESYLPWASGMTLLLTCSGLTQTSPLLQIGTCLVPREAPAPETRASPRTSNPSMALLPLSSTWTFRWVPSVPHINMSII